MYGKDSFIISYKTDGNQRIYSEAEWVEKVVAKKKVRDDMVLKRFAK